MVVAFNCSVSNSRITHTVRNSKISYSNNRLMRFFNFILDADITVISLISAYYDNKSTFNRYRAFVSNNSKRLATVICSDGSLASMVGGSLNIYHLEITRCGKFNDILEISITSRCVNYITKSKQG